MAAPKKTSTDPLDETIDEDFDPITGLPSADTNPDPDGDLSANDSIFDEDSPSNTGFAVGRPQTDRTVKVDVPEEYAEQVKAMLSNLSFGGDDGVRLSIERQLAASKQDDERVGVDEAAVAAHKERLDKLGVGQGTTILPPEMALREIRTQEKLEAKTLRMDFAPQGGQSYIGDTLVWNRNGKPVNE
jgi:hypothetical protein